MIDFPEISDKMLTSMVEGLRESHKDCMTWPGELTPASISTTYTMRDNGFALEMILHYPEGDTE